MRASGGPLVTPGCHSAAYIPTVLAATRTVIDRNFLIHSCAVVLLQLLAATWRRLLGNAARAAAAAAVRGTEDRV